MKALSNYISEAIKIGKSLPDISFYSCQPKTKEELIKIIQERISKEGLECDLNDIDTSLIDDMSWLFYRFKDFNGDMSKWNVSSVKDMCYMFYCSKFNGDISNWNVSNVKDMHCMFCRSIFNQDISNWKINKDCVAYDVFMKCPIEKEFKPKLSKR